MKDNTIRPFSMYFAIFGLMVLALGLAEIIVAITGGCFEVGPVILCDQEDFLLWRGVVLLSSGIFVLSAITDLSDIYQQAKLLVGNVMVWFVGGMSFLGMVLGSIPGPEDGAWINSMEGFIASYAGPYLPALLLLPFSLVPVAIFYRSIKAKDAHIGETNGF
ncbi:MAG TPA: hypothetical protein ENN11_04355 [Methanomicrobia archaeon]|nr:hypothetical protein [Methanomicrobia archaeon]